MALKVITDLLPEGHPNRPGVKLRGVKARVWHGTANFNSGSGDEANRDYFARKFTKQYNIYYKKYEYLEASGSPFRFGSTHAIIDKDSATICIPLDEICYGAGDRGGVYDKIFKGQTLLAHDYFQNEQNYRSWQIELCMNDMSAIDQVLANAAEFARDYLGDVNIPDFRHYDLTYKNCPSFMVTPGSEENLKWSEFKALIRSHMDELKFKREHPLIVVNGNDVTSYLPIRPYFVNGHTMAPIRVVQYLGAEVSWDRKTNTVSIDLAK